MKRTFICIVLLLGCILSNAQEKTRKTQFAIMGGLTSSVASIKEVTTENINQYHVGIAAKFPVASFFAVQPGLQYAVKGVKLSEFEGKLNANLSTGFIELPVQLQFGWDFKVVRPYVFAEPFLGYAVSNKINGEDTWNNIASKFEYGVGAGIGLDLFNHVQLSARYFWNLGDLYGFSWQSFTTVVNSKCNGISATVAILF